MSSGKFWLAVLAAGVVANIIDAFVMGGVLASTMASIESMRQDTNMVWFVVGDFLFVFVMVWFYDKVYGSFGGGPKGGATFGLYVGVICSFPMWIFIHLMFKGFPYSLAWILTIYGIVGGIIAGSVIGAVYKKPPAA